ncbi:MAG: TetR/AcrR family transcriptional regulator [Rickettsiales bacterium TMED289]|nr:MAG: TetR/AcrR family transcriptional regulator [Rickettsiales bacterium TMED289]
MDKKNQEDKKNAILMAAVKVLTTKGYYSSTMDDIVDEAEISKGAIYHYFSSKKDVYLAVIEMWENQTQEMLAPVAVAKSSKEGIRDLFKLFVKQLEIDGSFFNCLPTLWAIARHDNDFKKSMQRVYNRFQKFIELIILKGIENKEFVKLDPKIASLSLILNIEGIFYFNIFESKHVDAESYIDQISKYILNAYTKK